MKYFYIFLALFNFEYAFSQSPLQQPRCGQFETPIPDTSAPSGWKCVNQSDEQRKRQNEIDQNTPRCGQFETPIPDTSAPSGWKCVNQSDEQRKKQNQNSNCEPNSDLKIYKLQKNINQIKRSLDKKNADSKTTSTSSSQ